MKTLLVILLLMISFSWSYGQKERSYNRKGVKEYSAGDHNNAELDFMKALEVDSTSFAANYNAASNLYKLEKYSEANEVLAKLANNIDSPEHLPDMLHNLGNSFMKQEMYDKSIEAYKNSLRLRPDDDDTRYNLSYAQVKLKQQEEQEQEQDQDQDQDQDQENKEDQEQDQEQEQQEQEQDQQDQKEEQQPQENKELSKEDVERILQAIQEQEKEVKEKVDKEKAKVQKVKTEKDW